MLLFLIQYSLSSKSYKNFEEEVSHCLQSIQQSQSTNVTCKLHIMAHTTNLERFFPKFYHSIHCCIEVAPRSYQQTRSSGNFNQILKTCLSKRLCLENLQALGWFRWYFSRIWLTQNPRTNFSRIEETASQAYSAEHVPFCL